MKKDNVINGDPNMMVKEIGPEDILFYDVTKEPFIITGFPWIDENKNFNRIPERIMSQISKGLAWAAPQPSGGMIRFKTNSNKLSIRVELLRNETSRQCSQTLLSGFDVYVDYGEGMEFIYTLCIENNPLCYSAQLPSELREGIKSITIYTPLQNPIKSIFIGIAEGTIIEAPNDFTIKNPILFYGSSITCGFCASRPGLTYPARISRSLNANFINFGFGGQAKGDLLIAKAISELNLSCLVMDYDYNAPCKDFLEATHLPFYSAIRKAKADLPIILISAPYKYKDTKNLSERRQIIEDTYNYARANGDTNIYYINGGEFMAKDEWADFTVDLVHPNDMGFSRMSEKILPYIKKALNIPI
ncbi:MAG TPA: SGNH/GDSL hydrolase family protein [Clostridiaceae bacterium]